MLKNAELKLDRADKHILDLEREFRAFIDGNAHSIIVEVNQDEGTVSIDAHSFRADELPKSTSPDVGAFVASEDALRVAHNTYYDKSRHTGQSTSSRSDIPPRH